LYVRYYVMKHLPMDGQNPKPFQNPSDSIVLKAYIAKRALRVCFSITTH